VSAGFSSRHLAVVGLGLMGGSLARALRPFAQTITGVEMNAASREYALANKIVDAATDDLREGVSDADVVILGAPVRVIIEMLHNRIGSYLRSNTLLLDIGSTKADICDAMGRLPIGIQAIGGHPMTGKESSGIEQAEATLFQGRPFVLCASRRTTPAARDRALGLIAAVGAVPIEMEAQRHDRTVAAISHLPYLISAALVATVAQEGETDDAVWRLAAGGFRDTSRLAAQDLSMMGDILSTNTQAVATLLAIFRMKLAMIEASLIAQENSKLIDLLRPTREARIAWQKQIESGHK
jgi:prephenate dehydrogenase